MVMVVYLYTTHITDTVSWRLTILLWGESAKALLANAISPDIWISASHPAHAKTAEKQLKSELIESSIQNKEFFVTRFRSIFYQLRENQVNYVTAYKVNNS